MKTLLINGSPVNNGATAEIISLMAKHLSGIHSVETVCLGDMDIRFCRGCKACYQTARCGIEDDVISLIDKMDNADNVIIAAPSYWADIPGQLKVFFDRCTPYCDVNHKAPLFNNNKKGYAISLRTGSNENECLHIIDSIAHYYGHMNIKMEGSFYLCKINTREDVLAHFDEIRGCCDKWFR